MKKPSKPKLIVNRGKTPGSEAAASERQQTSPLMQLFSGKKDYKKAGSRTPQDMGTEPGGFGMTGLTGES